MPSLPGVVPRKAPRKSRPRLSFHPCTSVWSVERDEPVLDVTRAPRGPWPVGFSYSFGKMGLPTLAPAALHPPLSANEVLPKLRAGFKTTTKKKKKKEAQTYSRKGLPGGSRRRTRRGPRPEMVTAASRCLRISRPPSPVLAPHALSGMHPVMPDCVPTTSYPPKAEQLLGFVANTPPHPKTSRPSASQLPLLSRSGTNSPVLK